MAPPVAVERVPGGRARANPARVYQYEEAVRFQVCLRPGEAAGGALGALIDRAESHGCLELSEVDELVQALDLDDNDLGTLYETLDARGIELRDNCGRDDGAAAARRAPSSLRPRRTRSSSSSTRSAATACSRPSRRSTSPSASSAATSPPRSA